MARRTLGRLLRGLAGLADWIDPMADDPTDWGPCDPVADLKVAFDQMAAEPRAPSTKGMYVLDFTRGEVWLDGELVSRGSTDG